MTNRLDLKFMKAAISESKKDKRGIDVPVGAVAVKDGRIIARAHNQREKKNDPTAHAEILCIQKAAKKIKNWRLDDVTLYCTLEPCPMCMSAILQARVKELFYGTHATDPNSKKVKTKITSGILGGECSSILMDFFKKLRK